MRLGGVGVDGRVSVQAVTSKIVALGWWCQPLLAVVIARANICLVCDCEDFCGDGDGVGVGQGGCRNTLVR